MKISRILVFIVVFSLCFCSLAFADDLEPDSSGSSSSAISDEDMDNAIRDLSNSLYQVQLLNDTRVTTYTATDIYNFMVNHFLMGGAQNGYMYQQYSTLLALNTKVQAIMSYSNSIREYTELIHDSITGDNTPITLYDLIGDHLGNIANMLAITEGNTTLSAGELLLLINNTIDDSYLALGNIQTTLDSIQDNIALLYAVMTDIAESNNDIVNQTTTMNANMQLMIARLQSMQNDFNNVVWSDYDNSYLGFTHSLSDISYTTGTFNVSNYPTGYFIFKNPALNGNFIFKISVPVRCSLANNINNFFSSISLVRSNGGSVNGKYYVSYDILRQHLNIYVYDYAPFYASSNNIVVKIDFTQNYVISTGGFYSYLQDNQLDYYTAYQYLTNKNQNNILSKFETLYASDDLIKSKEEQQPVENQIIEDFTGNGSASVSVGDAVNVKQASNAIKSGLNTGANSGLALDYAFGYNNPTGLFIWFTQDTADWFTLYQPTRGVKSYSDVIWSDEIPDHITELDNKYIRGLSND